MATPREFDDQGDVEDLLVQGPAVLPASVVVELFAVIRGDDDQGVPEEAERLEPPEELSEPVVTEEDFAVVTGQNRIQLVGREGGARSKGASPSKKGGNKRGAPPSLEVKRVS